MKKKIMAHILALVMALNVCMAYTNTTTYAETTKEGDYEYSVLEDGTVEITRYLGEESVVNIPEEIDGKTVSSLGWSAYNDCVNLTKIVIPSDVIDISSGTFSGCTSLSDIQVSLENRAYSSEGGVLFNKSKSEIVLYPEGKKEETYNIPEGVTSIGQDAFENCANLVEITIPEDVDYIGWYAFSDCSNLREVLLPENVTWLSDNIFSGCKSLAKVTMPKELDYIGSGAFSGCSSLREIIIPDGVTGIGPNAFYGCSSLKEIKIPENITQIWEFTFSGCNSLEEVKVPKGISGILFGAFSDCKSLKGIYVDPENENYISEDGILFDREMTTILAYPAGKTQEIYKIPESVTRIEHYAFEGSKLVEVTLPENVDFVSDDSFYCCTSLTNIQVSPDNKTYSSEDGVLFDKSKRQIIAYPAGKKQMEYCVPEFVSEIEGRAFDGCENLKSLVFYSINVPDMSDFESEYSVAVILSGLETIYVPDEAYDDYVSLWTGLPEGMIHKNTENPNLAEDAASMYEYTINLNDGNVCITKYLGEESVVSIPEKIHGMKVTEIGNSVFLRNDKLIEVNIPESVNTIESNAFGYCSNLAKVNIPKNVLSMWGNTFPGCTSLKDIQVSPENQNYSSEDGILFDKDKSTILAYPAGKTQEIYTIPESVTTIGNSAFEGCSNLESVMIPNSVSTIEGGAFMGCSSLSEVEIPEGVTQIAELSFMNCSSLKKVTIPESVDIIRAGVFCGCSSLTEIYIPQNVTLIGMSKDGLGAFSGCESLINIYVSPNNEKYSSEDGVLFNKDKTVVEKYPEGRPQKEYSVPEGVTQIWPDAFGNCKELTEVTIPESVIVIGWSAFSGSENLKTITLKCSEVPLESLYEGNDFWNIAEESLPALEAVYVPDASYDAYKTAWKDLPEGVLRRLSEKLPIQIYGDPDGDGETKVTDALIVLRSVVGSYDMTPTQIKAADVDGDGEVNVRDALWMLRKVVGSINVFPVEEMQS